MKAPDMTRRQQPNVGEHTVKRVGTIARDCDVERASRSPVTHAGSTQDSQLLSRVRRVDVVSSLGLRKGDQPVPGVHCPGVGANPAQLEWTWQPVRVTGLLDTAVETGQ